MSSLPDELLAQFRLFINHQRKKRSKKPSIKFVCVQCGKEEEYIRGLVIGRRFLCSEHRKGRRQNEGLQDVLFTKYPDELTWVYEHLRKVQKKEPSPSAVVTLFKDNYPELWNRIHGKEVANANR